MTPALTLRELAEETGVSPRLIRYWIEHGNVDKAKGHSIRGNYDHRHIAQVRRMIRIDHDKKALRERARNNRIVDAPKLQNRS